MLVPVIKSFPGVVRYKQALAMSSGLPTLPEKCCLWSGAKEAARECVKVYGETLFDIPALKFRSCF
jgi:hypothetical protein